MELDGLDGDGSLVGVEVFEQLLYVFHSEQSVDAVEDLRLIGREEWCEEALRGAAPPLELARSARLPGAAS